MSRQAKVLGISDSPRTGNAEALVQAGLEGVHQLEGVATTFYAFHGKRICG